MTVAEITTIVSNKSTPELHEQVEILNDMLTDGKNSDISKQLKIVQNELELRGE